MDQLAAPEVPASKLAEVKIPIVVDGSKLAAMSRCPVCDGFYSMLCQGHGGWRTEEICDSCCMWAIRLLRGMGPRGW